MQATWGREFNLPTLQESLKSIGGVELEENFEEVVTELYILGRNKKYTPGAKAIGMTILPELGMNQRDESFMGNEVGRMKDDNILPRTRVKSSRGGIDIYTMTYDNGRVEEYTPNAETGHLQFHRVVPQDD